MTDRQYPVVSPKKLIEVALPLDAINVAASREKSIRHGHPSTLHLWWARRPLAAARAVIFSQLVNDPEDLWRCQNPDQEPNAQVKGHWTKARAKLFSIIENLVKWENTTNEKVLDQARAEIRNSWHEVCRLNKDHPEVKRLFNPAKMPGLHDPFAGGGTIPLEAQRLGLESYASDLNPVAVLINKAMIEIPPKFFDNQPVNPDARSDGLLTDNADDWTGAKGLANDIRYYGKWVLGEALKRIGHLYPPIKVTAAMARDRPDLITSVGETLTVIAWLWVRTVKSPNPAYSHLDVPLASSYVISSNEGKDAYIEPVIRSGDYEFTVKLGKPPADARGGTKSSRGANFRCLMSQVAISPEYIKAEAMADRMGTKLMGIVAIGNKGRFYLSPTMEQEMIAKAADPKGAAASIHVPLANDPRNLWCLQYGLDHFDKLFTGRQLVGLTTLSDLIQQSCAVVSADAINAGVPNGPSLSSGGGGAHAYGEAVSVYLAFAANKCADYGCTIATWMPRGTVGHAFSKQAIPMTWDFPEANQFSQFHCSWTEAIDWVASTVETIANAGHGQVEQSGAAGQGLSTDQFVSTDPPYYDNIGYADLSDFFYVWLRRSLRDVFPTILATITVPKSEELVANPYRHGTKENAEKFFLDGMTSVMQSLAEKSHPAAPITIYYAFKQSETEGDGTNSTGWETFLEAVNRAGLALTGTWPMRTERSNRSVAMGTNALASSIILVCRRRAVDASSISRRAFIRELNAALPIAMDAMTRENEGLNSPVAPVDLSQAIIGPGMAVFSKYSAVLEADGSPMSVRVALQLINRFLAEDDFDSDTQFCLHWFQQYGWDTGQFGEADTLARAKGTSVEGVKQAGVLYSASGNVRLLKWAEYPNDWDPQSDHRLPIWEVLHQLIRVFNTDGETGAAAVFAAVQSKAEAARQLAYRLYTLCERKSWAEDARAYNEVVTSWSGIESAAAKVPTPTQRTLFD